MVKKAKNSLGLLTAVVALAPAENQIKLDSAGKLGLEIDAGSSS